MTKKQKQYKSEEPVGNAPVDESEDPAGDQPGAADVAEKLKDAVTVSKSRIRPGSL